MYNQVCLLSIVRLWYAMRLIIICVLKWKLPQAKFRAARIFKNCIDLPHQSLHGHSPKQLGSGPRSVTGITFDDRGDTLVMSAEDESFRLYSCKNGK